MVHTLNTHKKERTVDVTLDIHNIYDIINALNQLIANKEDEMNKFSGGDSQDKEQYTRYKKLLGEMQQVKGKLK